MIRSRISAASECVCTAGPRPPDRPLQKKAYLPAAELANDQGGNFQPAALNGSKAFATIALCIPNTYYICGSTKTTLFSIVMIGPG